MVIIGLTALRSACLSSTTRSVSPLARAVVVYCCPSTSSMLPRMMRVSPAVMAVEITSAGTTKCLARSQVLPRRLISGWSIEVMPPIGSQLPVEAIRNNSSDARKKLGIDRPKKASTAIDWSCQRYWRAAAMTPAGIENPHASSSDTTDSSSVLAARCETSTNTGALKVCEKPKSPCAAFHR